MKYNNVIKTTTLLLALIIIIIIIIIIMFVREVMGWPWGWSYDTPPGLHQCQNSLQQEVKALRVLSPSLLLPVLCVGIEPFLGACRVDVMQLLLLLGLAVFVFLHFTCILHIGPVGRQHHQVVDLKQHHITLNSGNRESTKTLLLYYSDTIVHIKHMIVTLN